MSKESPHISAAPKIGPKGLTIMLALMCVVPLGTIAVLWNTLPPVKENQLECEVIPVNFLPDEFYDLPKEKREFPELSPPSVILKNKGDQEWSLIIVTVNRGFKTYETNYSVAPGGEMRVVLHHCRNKVRATTFNPTVHKITRVQVLAKLPDGSRASYTEHFDQS